MLELTVNAAGKRIDDLVLALEEVTRLLRKGYESGGDRNADGSYYFEREGEEGEDEDWGGEND